MSKQRQLFIRACKSRDPLGRLRSLYRRFYVTYIINEIEFERDFYDIVNWILSEICNDYGLITIERLTQKLNPENSWRYGIEKSEYDFEVLLMKVLISAIRLAEVSKFEGLTTPLKFRKTKENESYNS